MNLIQVPADEWRQLNENVSELLKMLKGKAINKTWVRMPEFIEITGKSRESVKYLLKKRPELRREREGEGVQINLREYNKIYA